MKLIFAPIGIAAGLLAGLVAQKGFDKIWSLFDDEEAPAPDHREVPYPKLVAALVVEGAVFRLTKGLVDHGVRSAFARTTGRWPGEERPETSWRVSQDLHVRTPSTRVDGDGIASERKEPR